MMSKQADDVMHLPWGGIFEPWRPFVVVAAAAARQRKHMRRSDPTDGLQMMLPLRPAPPDPQRPLFDRFPEAYPEEFA